MDSLENIYEFYHRIESRNDFERFLYLLKEKFKQDEESGEYWENNSLALFLDAMYYSNRDTTLAQNEKEVCWKDFAEILLTAIVYE